MLVRPQTPFMGLHAAFALAAGRDTARLDRLRRHCRQSADAVLRTVVASVCEALLAVEDRRWGAAATLLADVQPVLAQVGGSAAQREVVEETLLLCLLQDSRSAEVEERLTARLSRRASPLDRRRLLSLQAAH
jgi:hypothetical protein